MIPGPLAGKPRPGVRPRRHPVIPGPDRPTTQQAARQLPGGFKQSGIGREGGTEGLLPFLETKTVILEGPPARYSK